MVVGLREALRLQPGVNAAMIKTATTSAIFGFF
jgi:hypothetical protein